MHRHNVDKNQKRKRKRKKCTYILPHSFPSITSLPCSSNPPFRGPLHSPIVQPCIYLFPSSIVISCRLEPTAPTSIAGVNLSSTRSSPTLRPRRALPQELPPLSCPLPLTRRYPPPGADDTDPDSANVAMAAGKLCGLDQRYWFSWSHPPTTHGR
jgi:hypothetical protein